MMLLGKVGNMRRMAKNHVVTLSVHLLLQVVSIIK